MTAALLRKLFALAILLAPIAGCSNQAEDVPADLTLLTTGTVNGYVEPCGCVVGQIGGIDRIAAYIEDELDSNPNAFFVDTGDLIAEKFTVIDAVRKQSPLKAEAFFSVWGDLGCSAMALGENELFMLGVEELQKLSARHAIPILCANLVDKQGEQVFESYVIIERAGKRIGIFSLLAPKLEEPVITDPQTFDIAALLRTEGLKLEPWRVRAAEIIEELLPQTDMILCASHLGFDINERLAKSFPQIDLVFGGHFGQAKKERNFVAGTPVIVSAVRGARVDRIEWWWPNEDRYFVPLEERRESGNGPVIDDSRRGEVNVEFEVAQAEVDSISRREDAHTPERFTELYEDKVYQINQAERTRAGVQAIPKGNRFSHVPVPMHRALRRSENALLAVDHYHDELQNFWNTRSGGDEPLASVFYKGPEACIECHPLQVDFWKATRHSFALAALETTKQEVDAECFHCHTVGYRQPEGFRRPAQHQGFENVQCAACHGPAGRHMAGGSSFFETGLLLPNGASTCTQCHNKEHDPNFGDSNSFKLAMVACPSLEAVEDRTQTMRAAAALAAEAYQMDPIARWSELAMAYLKAGLEDKALQVCESWVVERPKSKEAHASIGQLLLKAGRLEESVRHFEFVTRKAPTDIRGWDGLARALMYTEPERALISAREAQSLEQSDPMRVKTLAEVLIAQGRRGAAEEVLAGFLEFYPRYADFVANYLASLDEAAATSEQE